jgi:hypothetical protein
LHKNVPYIIKAIEEDVTKTDEDLRRKYLKASDNKKSKEMMLENLGQMFINQQKRNCQTITNIRETLQKLQVQFSLLFSAVVIMCNLTNLSKWVEKKHN